MVSAHSFLWFATDRGVFRQPEGAFELRLMPAAMLLGLLPLSLGYLAGFALRKTAAPLLPRIGTRPRRMAIAMAGLSLIAFGYLRNWLSDFCVERWDVLQLVGASTLLILLLLDLGGVAAVAAAGALVIAVAKPLEEALLLPELYFVRGWNLPVTALDRPPGPLRSAVASLFGVEPGRVWDLDPIRILVGDPHGMFAWPIVPWFGTVALGFAVAHLLEKRPEARRPLALGGVLLVATSVALGSFVPVFDPNNLTGEAIFLPRAGFLPGLVGFATLLVLAGEWAARRFRPRVASGIGPLAILGRGILVVYLVHTWLGERHGQAIRDFVGVPRGIIDFRDPEQIARFCAAFGIVLAASWGAAALGVATLGRWRLRIRLRRVAAN